MVKKTQTGDRGMLWNYPDLTIERPCSGECTILRQLAGLEYANGTSANIDLGMWLVISFLSSCLSLIHELCGELVTDIEVTCRLHHRVGLVSGPSRWDSTCYGKISLPHWSVSGMPSRTERYFSSGNERTSIDSNAQKSSSGYHLYDRMFSLGSLI
jgi:hypothetical protein